METITLPSFIPGVVYFAGVGPGDIELMTCKVRRLIQSAQVILYAGSLINPQGLIFASPAAQLYNTAQMSLTEQVQVMIAAANEQNVIARLHSGDPSIYGSISEQMAALDEVGIAYRVIPGVSSAFAAAAALGIEYTLPESTQTVIFTRQVGRTPSPHTEQLHILAQHKTSLVIFLSTSLVDEVVKELRKAGYSDATPLAFVYRASWEDEVVLRSCLGEISQELKKHEFTHQGLFLVSPALEQRQTTFSHLYGAYQQKPMRREGIAILGLTKLAAKLSRKLFSRVEDSWLYLPDDERVSSEQYPFNDRITYFKGSIRPFLQEAFQKHKGLVCIMAAGIVMRELAPLLQNKHTDAAVVVMDVEGKYAVSLLAGHEGGANELAQQVAAISGGQAVITTASDTLGLPAIDVFARLRGWFLLQQGEDSHLAACMAALVNGEKVAVYQDSGEIWLRSTLPNTVVCEQVDELLSIPAQAKFYISIKSAPEELLSSKTPALIYHPPLLVVGVGCNSGTGMDEIHEVISTTLIEAELSIYSVAAIATIEEKAQEAGILETCKSYGWQLKTVSAEQINELFVQLEEQARQGYSTPSTYAQRALGVWGVAEPAAMLVARSNKLLLPKRKFTNVTVAVAILENG